MEISNQTLGQEIAKIIYPHFVIGTLIAYQHITFQRYYSLKLTMLLYKYDFICLPEAFLDSSIQSDHVSLELEGYKFVRADYLNTFKRDGVCIYYKESLPVRAINLPYLQEALLLELNDQNKKVFIAPPVKAAKNSKVF